MTTHDAPTPPTPHHGTGSPRTISPVISCHGLTKSYAGRPVLDGFDIEIRPGRVHGFLGRNGAGKSTTIRMILGLEKPDAGRIRLFGGAWERRALDRIGASVDGPALYGHLSARDNLTVHARLLGCSRSRIDEVLGMVGLEGTGRKRARSFSTGMKMRLALAIALLGDPEVLILDEPQNGLDPQGIVELRLLLRARAAAGGAVLVSSHQLGEVSRLVDDITVLAAGRCQWSGPLDEFAPAGMLEERFLELTMTAEASR